MAASLEGIRVCDFTWVVAGPITTKILADHGAEVIKVERMGTMLAPRRSGLFGDINRNKRSIAINMADPAGVDLARELVRRSHIVIDNFSARVMRSWGMDYESLSKIKPDIICMSMSGLGHTGPRRSWVSYGPTIQSLAGYTLMMADGTGRPAGYGYSYADMAGGYTGALAALFALWHLRRTGKGQFIDLAQFEAAISVIGPSLLDIAANGRPAAPFGYTSQEKPAAPHGAYRCRARDGDDERWLAITAQTQAQWDNFVRAIGSPQWSSDPKFQTLFLRIRNRAELDANISRWARNVIAEEAMALLQAAGVPAGVVQNGQDLADRDPHLKFRNYFRELGTPEGESVRVTDIPVKLAVTPGAVRTVAPEIGEDNEYVLAEVLGLGQAERDRLITSGAVFARQ